jgi:hypothetical protein
MVDQPVDGFTVHVQEQIGWYVYLLRDPRNGRVFYVGKGRGNRVFEHAHAALGADQDAPGAKLALIREIVRSGLAVRTEILRHRIETEKQAYAIESAVIDTFRALGYKISDTLTNEVLGHRTALFGWAGTDVVASIYQAEPLAEVDDDVIFVKIPRLWTPAIPDAELFEATHGFWKLGERARRARYAIAVHNQVTRAVYEIDYWRERIPGERGFVVGERPRLAFWGTPAGDRADLMNRSIAHMPQPSGGSVFYLNCDPKGPTRTSIYRGDEALEKAAEEPIVTPAQAHTTSSDRWQQRDDVLGDAGPWIHHLALAWQMAIGEPSTPPPDPTIEEDQTDDVLFARIAWWSPLLHLLVHRLGWSRPAGGLQAWHRQNWATQDDATLTAILTWWGPDRLVDFAAWADGLTVEWFDGQMVAHWARATRNTPLAERRRSEQWQRVWGGGYDPFHLVDHLVHDGNRSAPGERTSYAHEVFETYPRAAIALASDPRTMTASGEEVTVHVNGLGCLGRYRRSSSTRRWHATSEAIHMLGNGP